MPDFWRFEKQAWEHGHVRVAGVDEAGRGPLAGPVVSAAVVLPRGFSVSGVADSKTLSPKKRDALYDAIYGEALAVGIGIVDAAEIDRINILRAALLCMAFSVDNLAPGPDHVLVDGPFKFPSDVGQTAICHGDAQSISIAAASIIAKVTRDRLMDLYDREYPVYGFARHKGYGTREHREAVVLHGPCPIHRRSFKGGGRPGR